VLFDSQVAGSLDHVDAMRQSQQQEVDELSIPIIALHVMILDLFHPFYIGSRSNVERQTV